MTNMRQVVFNSCGHYYTCVKCTRTIMKKDGECPICRKKIEGITRVFG